MSRGCGRPVDAADVGARPSKPAGYGLESRPEMRKGWRRRILWVLALAATQGTTGTPGLAQADSQTDVALRYLDALYDLDFERLESLLAPAAAYLDPTGVVLSGQPYHYVGREEIIAAFRRSVPTTRNTRFEVASVFDAGDLVVLHLRVSAEFHASLVGGADEWLSASSISAVTILRIRNGWVHEHTDYADYPGLLEQLGGPSPGVTPGT